MSINAVVTTESEADGASETVADEAPEAIDELNPAFCSEYCWTHTRSNGKEQIPSEATGRNSTKQLDGVTV